MSSGLKGDIPEGSYEIKLGASWDSPGASSSSRGGSSKVRAPQPTFHTLKYDFKPKSVSNESETYIGMGQNGDVAVPGDSDALTLYKGSAQKPAKEAKECLLFYNPANGEIRLEKVHSNITVKKTRDADPATESYLKAEIVRLRTSSKPRGKGLAMNGCGDDGLPLTGPRVPREPIQEPHRPERERLSSSSSSSSGGSSSDDSEEEDFTQAPGLDVAGGTAAPPPRSQEQAQQQPRYEQMTLNGRAPPPSRFDQQPPIVPAPSHRSSASRGLSESSAMDMSSSDDDDEMTKQLEREMSKGASGGGSHRSSGGGAASGSSHATDDSMPILDLMVSRPAPPQLTSPLKKSGVLDDLALSESSDEDD